VEDGGDDGHQEHRAGADQAAEIEKPQMKSGDRSVGTDEIEKAQMKSGKRGVGADEIEKPQMKGGKRGVGTEPQGGVG
jgi:hypothetical protein